ARWQERGEEIASGGARGVARRTDKKKKKKTGGASEKGAVYLAGQARGERFTRAPPLGSTASHRPRPTPATSESSRSSAPDRVPPAAPCRGYRRRSARDEDCCRAR